MRSGIGNGSFVNIRSTTTGSTTVNVSGNLIMNSGNGIGIGGTQSDMRIFSDNRACTVNVDGSLTMRSWDGGGVVQTSVTEIAAMGSPGGEVNVVVGGDLTMSAGNPADVNGIAYSKIRSLSSSNLTKVIVTGNMTLTGGGGE